MFVKVMRFFLKAPLAAAPLALLSVTAACEPGACTPEEQGLDDTVRLAPRELPGRAAKAGACTAVRLEVITSDSELHRLYGELGIGGGEGSGDYPNVDFSRERVIVREGAAGETIAWAVARGDTAVLGLASCAGQRPPPSCVVNVIAVAAPITRVETRTCEPVGCAPPRPAPVRQLSRPGT